MEEGKTALEQTVEQKKMQKEQERVLRKQIRKQTGKMRLLMVCVLALAVLVPSPALTMEVPTVYGAVVAISALLAILAGQMTEGALLKAEKDPISVGDLALACVPAAFICARLSYVLFRPSYYLMEQGVMSILRTWEGGFLLYGAMAGAMGAAVWMAKRHGKDVWTTLDRLVGPGLLMLALCRLAECTVGEGLGPWVESPLFERFPFAVCNAYGEWQISVFLMEGFAALVMIRKSMQIKAGNGERILRALLMLSSSQIVMESLRMDSCLKVGFVRVSQVMSGVVLLVLAVLSARRQGKNLVQKLVPVVIGVAIVGGLEWALDKTVISNLVLYAVMTAVCAGMYLAVRGPILKEKTEKETEAV